MPLGKAVGIVKDTLCQRI